MRRCASGWLLAGLAAVFAGRLVAQDEAELQALRRVQVVLDAAHDVQLERLEGMLREAGDRPALRGLIHFHLGRLALQQLRGTVARDHLRRALELCKPTAREFRSRLLYGMAQAAELLDRHSEARTRLKELGEVAADLPYGRLGRLALRRLDGRAAGRLRIGTGAPEIAGRRDSSGATRRLVAGDREATLLIFFRHDDAAALRWVRAWIAAFSAGGGQLRRVLLFDRSRAARGAVGGPGGVGIPVIEAEGGFLDPIWLDYSVPAVPHALLIGPDLRICAKNPRPVELRRATQVLTSSR